MNAKTTQPQDDDDIPAEIDFSKGVCGKFYKANAKLHLPMNSDDDVPSQVCSAID